MLEYFKNQKVQFPRFSIQRVGESPQFISDVLRSSEEVMEEAEILSTTYLKEAVQKIPPPVLQHRWDRGLDMKHLKQIFK